MHMGGISASRDVKCCQFGSMLIGLWKVKYKKSPEKEDPFDKGNFGRIPSCLYFCWKELRTNFSFDTFSAVLRDFFHLKSSREMLVEPRNPVTSSTQAFVPYKDGMSVRLPPTAVDLTRPMPSMVLGQNARNRRHHTSASLEAIRAVQEDVLRSSRARMGPNQEALQRLQNHSVAASAFTPTTSSLLRNSSLKYPPSGQNFLYGNLPSSPVKPSFVGHLPQLQASFSVPPPMSVPGQMLSFGYPPVSMVPPAVTSATYSPFIHMLSAAGQFLPFGYPAKKMFRCSDCRYMTDRKNNLKRHMATMHGDCEKVLECCDVVFKSKASLREHVLLFHQAGYRYTFFQMIFSVIYILFIRILPCMFLVFLERVTSVALFRLPPCSSRSLPRCTLSLTNWSLYQHKRDLSDLRNTRFRKSFWDCSQKSDKSTFLIKRIAVALCTCSFECRRVDVRGVLQVDVHWSSERN